MPDYQKTQIYSIVSNLTKEFYIGSTTDFKGARYHHKSSCQNVGGKQYNYKLYQMIRAKGGWMSWTMSRIEAYPCTSKSEARQRELYWYPYIRDAPTRPTYLPTPLHTKNAEKLKINK